MSNGQIGSDPTPKTFHLLGNAQTPADFQEESALCIPMKRAPRDDVRPCP